MSIHFPQISDLYKDTHYCRPDTGWLKMFADKSKSEQHDIWSDLCDMLDRQIHEQDLRQAKARVRFADRISEIASDFQVSPGRAIMWDMDGDVDEELCYNDFEIERHLINNGLAYKDTQFYKDMVNRELS